MSSSLSPKLKVSRFFPKRFQEEYKSDSNEILLKNKISEDKDVGINVLNDVHLVEKQESLNAWSKPANIKVNSVNNVEMSEDGVDLKLHSDNELENIHRLRYSIVIKVFGNLIPYSLISRELRNQWSKFGSFHITGLGKEWILCSFQSTEAKAAIFSGSSWHVTGHIIEAMEETKRLAEAEIVIEDISESFSDMY
ncbi:uncharacterized protein LOC110096488 [Dendrobium catenatum]|uniref:uncharacterized protein LOC110096488 n=1 Tax=Dendrobium catenatum TaxID=906689 RepID=UPI0009F659D6|nr:uncharacterized protein LOC110096488 [Dendrobium catenatum]